VLDEGPIFGRRFVTSGRAALEFAAAHADESSRTLWRLKVGLR
jgi:hypothetical protein